MSLDYLFEVKRLISAIQTNGPFAIIVCISQILYLAIYKLYHIFLEGLLLPFP